MKVSINNVLELAMSISTYEVTIIECPPEINKSLAFDIADKANIGFGLSALLYLPPSSLRFSKKIEHMDISNNGDIHLMDKKKWCELDNKLSGYQTYVNDEIFKTFQDFKNDIAECIKEEEIGLIIINDALTIFENANSLKELCTQLKKLQKKIEIPIAVLCDDGSGITDFNIITLPDHMKNDGSKGKEFALVE